MPITLGRSLIAATPTVVYTVLTLLTFAVGSVPVGEWEMPELSPLMGGENMDPLDRLIETARHASSVDRRLERTIRLILQARETVLQAH